MSPCRGVACVLNVFNPSPVHWVWWPWMQLYGGSRQLSSPSVYTVHMSDCERLCVCVNISVKIYPYKFEGRKKKDLRRTSVGVRIITASNLKLLQARARALFKRCPLTDLGLMWAISSQNWTAGFQRQTKRECICTSVCVCVWVPGKTMMYDRGGCSGGGGNNPWPVISSSKLEAVKKGKKAYMFIFFVLFPHSSRAVQPKRCCTHTRQPPTDSL